MNNFELNEDFKDIKEKYVAARESERKKIKHYLESKGFEIETSSGEGKGKKHYVNSQRKPRLKKQYDLRNWKYVEVHLEDLTIFISLQAFDRDVKHNNYHVLMDRLGLCIHPRGIKPNYFTIMDDTEFDLPLGEVELEELYQLILSEIEEYKKGKRIHRT